MLQPRCLLAVRKCASCCQFTPLATRQQFSIYRYLLEEQKPKPRSPYFLPTASVNTRPAFKDSPVKSISTEDSLLESPLHITVDNIERYEEKQKLPQTGKYSGRTVSCQIGRMGQALNILNKITRDNRVAEEWQRSRVHYPPSTARRMLRSRRHRIRFKQGVARLANIVLRMRKKSY